MKDKKYLAWLAEILDDEPQRVNCNYSYRKTRALEIIARCQIRQTQIAEQSFKETKGLRDVTMGMMKRDLKAGAKIDKAIDERIFLNNKELLIKDNLAACEDNSNENPDEDDEMPF